MRLISTAGTSREASFREAVLRGPAPDGGLYTPRELTTLHPETLDELRGRSATDVSLRVLDHLLGEEAGELHHVLESALDFPVPLRRLDDRLYALELFHGPTLAFKDVGARFLARLIHLYRREDDPPLTVLVATSGDTGSAVGSAFLGLDNTRVVVLFPKGKVSERQELQFTTLGGNVTPVAVRGDFDDCQRLVKEAFGSIDVTCSSRLTSANSINIGRLLPQIFYYFAAWAGIPQAEGPPRFSVPCGNLGNLTAALLALRLGLPARPFVAATNVNDSFIRYLRTGRHSPSRSVHTLSSAMDVGDPGNLHRIRFLYPDGRRPLTNDVTGVSAGDSETIAAIRRLYDRYGYLADPHTAVAYLAIEGLAPEPRAGPDVFLATAHPSKFPDAVEQATGLPVAVPERLAERLNATPSAVEIGPRIEELKEVILEAGGGA